MTEPFDIYVTDDTAWATFLGTEIRVDMGSGGKFIIGATHAEDPQAGAAGTNPSPLLSREPIHVLTACNPGAIADAATNAAANERLRIALVTANATIFLATGSSPDGTWSEDGFAVFGLSTDAAIALGRQFGQMAIFEITKETVAVLSCTGNRRMERRTAVTKVLE